MSPVNARRVGEADVVGRGEPVGALLGAGETVGAKDTVGCTEGAAVGCVTKFDENDGD